LSFSGKFVAVNDLSPGGNGKGRYAVLTISRSDSAEGMCILSAVATDFVDAPEAPSTAPAETDSSARVSRPSHVKLANGGKCTGSMDCQSGHCRYDVCAKSMEGGIGDRCGTNIDCASHDCGHHHTCE
ncbi:MAG TPA: hypothetical protein VGI86_00670, partial [Acidimicrobiia bacterium]